MCMYVCIYTYVYIYIYIYREREREIIYVLRSYGCKGPRRCVKKGVKNLGGGLINYLFSHRNLNNSGSAPELECPLKTEPEN